MGAADFVGANVFGDFVLGIFLLMWCGCDFDCAVGLGLGLSIRVKGFFLPIIGSMCGCLESISTLRYICFVLRYANVIRKTAKQALSMAPW